MNIPRSVEHGCQRTVAPPFGGLHSARASLQTTPLGSAHVQETGPIRKNLSNNKLINDIFHLN